MEQRKPIVLTEDLIKIWAERTGKDEALLKELLSIHLKYIDHLIDTEEDCLSIGLPGMGRLKLNYYMSLSYLKYLNKDNKYFGWATRKVELLQSIGMEISHQAMNFNRPLFTKQFYKITGDKTRGAFAKFYLYWSILETSHNDWYKNKHRK